MERVGEFIAWSGKSKIKCLEEITSVAWCVLASEIIATNQECTVVHLNNDKGSSEQFRTLWRRSLPPSRGGFFRVSFLTMLAL